MRRQVPGLTKQSGRSACVLCRSGGAGEPAQQPSGRLGHSWEKGAGIGIWDFRVCVCGRFSGKVDRGGLAQAPQLAEGLLPGFNVYVIYVYLIYMMRMYY